MTAGWVGLIALLAGAIGGIVGVVVRERYQRWRDARLMVALSAIWEAAWADWKAKR